MKGVIARNIPLTCTARLGEVLGIFSYVLCAFLSSLYIWSVLLVFSLLLSFSFLKTKGVHILDAWEGNKLKFSHCVLCFTDWLDIAYENSIGVFFES